MYPKISLNDVTIRPAPFADRFPIAQQAGFSGLELWMNDIREFASKNGGLQRVAKLLRDHQLRLDHVLLLADVFSENHARHRSDYLAYAGQFFEDTRAIGGHNVLACATFDTTDVQTAGPLFAELCDLAATYDINLLLEFVGWAKTIKDLNTAWSIVDSAGRKNGGILFDTFHHFFGGTTLADLEMVPTSLLFGVHIVDAPTLSLPTLEISRKHRVFPGQGSIPISDILQVLQNKGYRGPLSLEIFNETYWQRPALEIAREGFAAMQSAIASAGFV